MERLEWNKLFCEERIRQSKASKKTGVVARNAFEADNDRIAGSSSVRRLQDKAQVFPLQKDDVVRTRLTHSIEVSALARSLGKAVGIQLENKGEFTREDTEKLAALLQTAGLIHDLGNPPFGQCKDIWYDALYQEAKTTGILDVVLEDNPYIDLNILRAMVLRRKYDMTYSERLKEIILKRCKQDFCYIETLSEIQYNRYHKEIITRDMIEQELMLLG